LFSKDQLDKTAWLRAAHNVHVKVIEKLWDLAKILQLTPDEIKNDVLLS
jgi:hypothetical protein